MFPTAKMKKFLKNIRGNGKENGFPQARIRSVFKKWFQFISVIVLASRKELSSKVDGLH